MGDVKILISIISIIMTKVKTRIRGPRLIKKNNKRYIGYKGKKYELISDKTDEEILKNVKEILKELQKIRKKSKEKTKRKGTQKKIIVEKLTRGAEAPKGNAPAPAASVSSNGTSTQNKNDNILQNLLPNMSHMKFLTPNYLNPYDSNKPVKIDDLLELKKKNKYSPKDFIDIIFPDKTTLTDTVENLENLLHSKGENVRLNDENSKLKNDIDKKTEEKKNLMSAMKIMHDKYKKMEEIHHTLENKVTDMQHDLDEKILQGELTEKELEKKKNELDKTIKKLIETEIKMDEIQEKMNGMAIDIDILTGEKKRVESMFSGMDDQEITKNKYYTAQAELSDLVHNYLNTLSKDELKDIAVKFGLKSTDNKSKLTDRIYRHEISRNYIIENIINEDIKNQTVNNDDKLWEIVDDNLLSNFTIYNIKNSQEKSKNQPLKDILIAFGIKTKNELERKSDTKEFVKLIMENDAAKSNLLENTINDKKMKKKLIEYIMKDNELRKKLIDNVEDRTLLNYQNDISTKPAQENVGNRNIILTRIKYLEKNIGEMKKLEKKMLKMEKEKINKEEDEKLAELKQTYKDQGLDIPYDKVMKNFEEARNARQNADEKEIVRIFTDTWTNFQAEVNDLEKILKNKDYNEPGKLVTFNEKEENINDILQYLDEENKTESTLQLSKSMAEFNDSFSESMTDFKKSLLERDIQIFEDMIEKEIQEKDDSPSELDFSTEAGEGLTPEQLENTSFIVPYQQEKNEDDKKFHKIGTKEIVESLDEPFIENLDEQSDTEITDNEKGQHGTGIGDNTGLWNDEIMEIMEPLKKKGFKGVYSIDQINQVPFKKKDKRVSFIMNTSPSSKKDGHWIAVLLTPNKLEYYDSFAMEPSPVFRKNIASLLEKWSPNSALQFKINRIKYQRNNSNNCGYFAIKFLKDRYDGKKFKEATGFEKFSKVLKGEKEIRAFKKRLIDFDYI